MKTRPVRPTLVAALVLAPAAAALLLSCGGSEPSTPGVPREPGDLYLGARVDYDPGPPEVRTCPDTFTDADGDTCPDDLAEFEPVPDAGVDLCANNVAVGALLAEAGNEGIVSFVLTGQDTDLRSVSLTVLDVDTEDIGLNEGPLDTPVAIGPCGFVATFDLDTSCAARCGDPAVSLSLYIDDQPDPCDGAVTWGAADSLTITEITIAEDEDGRPRVLENSVLAGTFTFAARNRLPTDPVTSASVQVVSGQFRLLVAAPSATLIGSDLAPCP